MPRREGGQDTILPSNFPEIRTLRLKYLYKYLHPKLWLFPNKIITECPTCSDLSSAMWAGYLCSGSVTVLPLPGDPNVPCLALFQTPLRRPAFCFPASATGQSALIDRCCIHKRLSLQCPRWCPVSSHKVPPPTSYHFPVMLLCAKSITELIRGLCQSILVSVWATDVADQPSQSDPVETKLSQRLFLTSEKLLICYLLSGQWPVLGHHLN